MEKCFVQLYTEVGFFKGVNCRRDTVQRVHMYKMYGLTALPRDYFCQISYSLTAPTLKIFTALYDHTFGEIKELNYYKNAVIFKSKIRTKEYQASLVK